MNKSIMDENGKQAIQVTILGVVTNLLLALLKGAVGVLAHSSAMVSDAVHSLSDLISDIVTLWAIYVSRIPKDENHPYGHGKFETLGTLFIALMLILAAIGTAANSFSHIENQTIPGRLALLGAIISILFKEGLYQYSKIIGKRTNSRLLLANAWHHRTDAFSSVIALIGVTGAIFGYPFLDPIAGILVSGWILKAGISIGYESLKELTDADTNEEIIKEVRNILKATQGVKKFHEVRARRMGTYTLIDLHAQVPDKVSVSVAHQTAERIKQNIILKIPEVSDVLVHIDSEDDSIDDMESKTTKLMRPEEDIQQEVRSVIEKSSQEIQISHMQCHYLKERLAVELNIEVIQDMKISDVRKIAFNLKAELLKIPDLDNVDIHLELNFDRPASLT